MSNLGLYQRMTTAAKKVGGPINLGLLTAAGGALFYKCVEMGAKAGSKQIQKWRINKETTTKKTKLHVVKAQGTSNEGLSFVVGDQFRILETDGDSVLIEKIGDENNPYFVSAELLHAISDYDE